VTTPDRLFQFYRTCRLEDQHDFYQRRSREFEVAAGQLATVATVLLFATTIVSGLAAFYASNAILAIFAVALPAASTAVAGFGALYAFDQQRKLYVDAMKSLREADAVEPSDRTAYADAVEEILAREQAQWGQVVGEIKPAGPAT
jgi:hypothetical protein